MRRADEQVPELENCTIHSLCRSVFVLCIFFPQKRKIIKIDFQIVKYHIQETRQKHSKSRLSDTAGKHIHHPFIHSKIKCSH